MLRRFFSSVPILGALSVCSSDDLKAASKEVFFTAAFATAPLWFWPIILLFIRDGRSKIGHYVAHILESGDLFIWSIAAAGPLLFYVLIDRYRTPDPTRGEQGFIFSNRIDFPHGNAFVIVSFLVCAVSTFFIITSKGATANGGLEVPLETDSVRIFSAFVFALITFCFFCASAVKSSITEFVNRGGYTAGENDFAMRWKQRR